MKDRLLSVVVVQEADTILIRQRARQVAELLGFDKHDQTRITTAVSEVTRNLWLGADLPQAEFDIEHGVEGENLEIVISGKERGNGDFQSFLESDLGFVGAQRLMDAVTIERDNGNRINVRMRKAVPSRSSRAAVHSLKQAQAAFSTRPPDLAGEVEQQNEELMSSYAKIRSLQEEVERLNQELEDTNRGVVALYAELDERADHLRRVDEIKTRFLSDMSHEFRTPLNSIGALTRLLLGRADGPLSLEQEKQVRFIRKAADNLTELVNDLLDIAKVESGKVDVQVAEFSLEDVFSALRGMLRPLLSGDQVNLVFDDVEHLGVIRSDENKVAQILRNLISNALKYTEQGEVRVSGSRIEGQCVVIQVRDTGIGIPPEYIEKIFQDFFQVSNPRQRLHKGTGLGLPLSRRLAELLGGSIGVASKPGQGSTFTLELPIVPEPAARAGTVVKREGPRPVRIVLIDDEEAFRYVIRQFLSGQKYQVLEAATAEDGLSLIHAERPDVVLLDLNLPEHSGEYVLERLRESDAVKNIPVIIVTASEPAESERERLPTILPKESLSTEVLVHYVTLALERRNDN